MKVIDILKDACTFLQMEDEYDYLSSYNIDSNTFSNESSDSVSRNVKLLSKCVSLVVDTICSEYIKLKDSVYVYTIDGRIKYSDISENQVYSIVSVEDDGGLVQFSDYNSEICVSNSGRYRVTYLYGISNLDYDSDLSIFRLPSKDIAYGVISEFLYIEKLYDDASIWDKRFKSTILNLLSNKKHLYIKPRRWY